ncbi:hypothetical protein KRP22_004962 [Phytophthora ramorum]|nr:hypothetical protein KRP22_12546 [Phytophthora ramorum]
MSGIALLLLTLPSVLGARSVWVAQELFSADNCSGDPAAVSLATVSSCAPAECSMVQVDNVTQFTSLECNVSDRFAYAEEVFGEFNYIVVEDYAGAGCENLRLTTVLPAMGSCATSTLYGRYSIIAVLFANGSAAISLFDSGGCSGDSFLNIMFDSGNISTGDCVEDYYKIYTSAGGGLTHASSGAAVAGTSSGSAEESSSSSSLSGLAIICIVLAAGVVGFMTAVFVWKRRSPGEEHRTEDSNYLVGYDSYTGLRNVPKSTAGTNNPNDRPTAAQALYKLHTILTTEFDTGSLTE